jgi:hypothetical protein
MITAEQIPDEAIETLCNHVGPVMTRADWRAAIAVALNAWEGATTEPRNWRTALILPLPKEPRT